MQRRTFLALGLAALGLVSVARGDAAAATGDVRLVMFEMSGCSNCRQFRAEMKDRYEASAIGARMPLEIHDYQVARRIFRLKYAITATPTFVVMQDGYEQERFIGFAGVGAFTRKVTQLDRKYAAR
jgi:hypothetical protein